MNILYLNAEKYSSKDVGDKDLYYTPAELKQHNLFTGFFDDAQGRKVVFVD